MATDSAPTCHAHADDAYHGWFLDPHGDNWGLLSVQRAAPAEELPWESLARGHEGAWAFDFTADALLGHAAHGLTDALWRRRLVVERAKEV